MCAIFSPPKVAVNIDAPTAKLFVETLAVPVTKTEFQSSSFLTLISPPASTVEFFIYASIFCAITIVSTEPCTEVELPPAAPTTIDF